MRTMVFVAVLCVPSASIAQGTGGQKETPKDAAKPAATLDQLIAEALRSNPDIRVAESKVREADAELLRTRLKVIGEVTTLHAEIQSDEAALEEAKVRLERAKILFEKKTISREDFDAAALQYQRVARQAALNQAKLPYLLGRSAGATKASVIDDAIKKQYAERVKDSKITDEEFLRRAMLDLTGRLPTVTETKSFLAMKDTDRRERWLDQIVRTHALPQAHVLGAATSWSSCIRCHDGISGWKRDVHHGLWLDQLARVNLRPDSPMSEKLRKVLDTTKRITIDNLEQSKLMAFLREQLPTVNLHVRSKFPRSQTVTAVFDEPIPMGAFLQFIEDETGCVFILRDYGIVVVSESEKLPPGAIRVVDFWKHGKQSETQTSGDKTEGDPQLKPLANDVRGKVLKVDANDASLVSISIGSNHGLQAGHTLEVFRLAPQPKYLGTIRLVNVTASQAVGRVTGNLRERIQAGDEVASRIIADGKASK